MADEKVKIVAIADTPQVQSVGGNSANVGCGSPTAHDAERIYASPEEGVRLIKAFFQISDSRQRQMLVERAEEMARVSP
jgi:hypothetical protein